MEKQEKQAIEILHMMCGNNGCVISDSGGKDSSVLKHIALKVKNRYGLEYKIRHNHTTVDAPETVYFIRREKMKNMRQWEYRMKYSILHNQCGS